MKNYTITVNGNVYDVTVEENVNGVAPRRAVAPVAAPVVAPVVQAAPVAAPAPVAAAPAGVAGSIKVEAGAAGKIFRLEKKIGDSVAKGDTVMILEAMKMEIPVVAPADGFVASIDVTVGEMVESGALLATLTSSAAPAPAPVVAPVAPAPAPAPVAPAPAPVAAAPVATGVAGGIRVEAGAAGKIFAIEKKVGETVAKGDAVLILEAMKMEIPVVAPEAGTVASIEVTVGQMVESGALLATLN